MQESERTGIPGEAVFLCSTAKMLDDDRSIKIFMSKNGFNISHFLLYRGFLEQLPGLYSISHDGLIVN